MFQMLCRAGNLSLAETIFCYLVDPQAHQSSMLEQVSQRRLGAAFLAKGIMSTAVQGNCEYFWPACFCNNASTFALTRPISH